MATRPSDRRQTQGFNQNPAAYAGTAVKAHEGTDYGTPTGDPVRAALPGIVLISQDNYGAYGRCIIVKHQDGSATIYAHLNVRLFGVGAWVNEGQVIAWSGWSGNVRPAGPAGAHLHFGYQPAALQNLNNGYWGCVDPEVLFKGGNTVADSPAIKEFLTEVLIMYCWGKIPTEAERRQFTNLEWPQIYQMVMFDPKFRTNQNLEQYFRTVYTTVLFRNNVISDKPGDISQGEINDFIIRFQNRQLTRTSWLQGVLNSQERKDKIAAGYGKPGDAELAKKLAAAYEDADAIIAKANEIKNQ